MATKSEWFDTIKESQKQLESIINEYHPANGKFANSNMRITAYGAEAACMNVRAQIYNERSTIPVIDQFHDALKNEDVNKLMNIFNQTWFGVPESTACWGLEGFNELVDLLQDPPED